MIIEELEAADDVMGEVSIGVVDGHFFQKKTKESLKEESIRDTKRLCSRVFFTLARDGAGTKRWSMRCMAGKVGTWTW